MQQLVFNQRTPNIIVVDDFYKNPDEIRKDALSQKFEEDERYYKGKRSPYRHLLPYVREEFQRLLGGIEINDWLSQPFNGTFQMTNSENPLVWHSDTQTFAAAIYLTPNSDVNTGTSFWKDKKYGCRRPPVIEDVKRINPTWKGEEELTPEKMCDEMYSEYNILHPDNWELVDRVGAIYNRLVIWDAKMIHSASSYGKEDRLVQLFFFSTK